MRKARFLGFRDDEGALVDPDSNPYPYKIGDIITVFPRFKGYQGPFPWTDLEPNSDPGPNNIFRESEIELLPDKELNLEDYL